MFLFGRMLVTFWEYGVCWGTVILQVAFTTIFPFRVRKILNLRVFEDESGKHWSKSVMDKQYEVLCISQFTLQCVLKGNKPDFHLAMPTEPAESFYNSFLDQLRKTYTPELIKGRQENLWDTYRHGKRESAIPTSVFLDSLLLVLITYLKQHNGCCYGCCCTHLLNAPGTVYPFSYLKIFSNF